jgi:hypothetical protein
MKDYQRELEEYGPRLQALLHKHRMYGHLDPGGAELTHPQFGKLRISAYSEKDDYKTVVAFLRKHGIVDE